jgi:hypothetical protein
MNNYQRILVLSGNYREFELWCREHNVNPKHPDPFVYYNDSNKIRGLRFSSVIRDGTWYNREDIDEDAIKSCLNR